VEPTKTLALLKFKFSPKALNAYYRCPRMFYFRHIKKEMAEYVFKPALAVGGVAHKALAELFRNRRDGLIPSSIEAHVDRYIRLERYPDGCGDDLRREHAPQIIGHVERALAVLPDRADVLEVEHEFDFTFWHPGAGANATLKSRVDLVVRHGDGIVDHVDYKTGKQGGDPIQNIISRVTVQRHLDLPSEQLRTVNVLTATGEYQIVPSDRAAHASTWQIVLREIGRLACDQEWTPRPEPSVCRWCDYKPLCQAGQQACEGGDDG
jgi:CRISPR/Cas system-associated exonuclease Cas4 (RecB family)